MVVHASTGNAVEVTNLVDRIQELLRYRFYVYWMLKPEVQLTENDLDLLKLYSMLNDNRDLFEETDTELILKDEQ